MRLPPVAAGRPLFAFLVGEGPSPRSLFLTSVVAGRPSPAFTASRVPAGIRVPGELVIREEGPYIPSGFLPK